MERKIISFMHMSLDGYVANKNHELNWVKIDDEIFAMAGKFTSNADTAIYGKGTYGIMEAYWPTAAGQPGASAHDKEHGAWYNSVEKIVLSTSLKKAGTGDVRIIGANVKDEIVKLKKKQGKDMMIFGSPRATQSLIAMGLVDEMWIFLNPIILGDGLPFFTKGQPETKLELVSSKVFSCGVNAMQFRIQN